MAGCAASVDREVDSPISALRRAPVHRVPGHNQQAGKDQFLIDKDRLIDHLEKSIKQARET